MPNDVLFHLQELVEFVGWAISPYPCDVKVIIMYLIISVIL